MAAGPQSLQIRPVERRAAIADRPNVVDLDGRFRPTLTADRFFGKYLPAQPAPAGRPVRPDASVSSGLFLAAIGLAAM